MNDQELTDVTEQNAPVLQSNVLPGNNPNTSYEIGFNPYKSVSCEQGGLCEDNSRQALAVLILMGCVASLGYKAVYKYLSRNQKKESVTLPIRDAEFSDPDLAERL